MAEMPRSVPATAVPQGYHAYRDEIDAAIRRVLESGWYILGREVEAFEAAFAAYCGVRHAIGVANGTDAIVLALRSLGIGPGDAVFTVSHTAVATVAAIELAGATPVLVDVAADSYTLDPQKLEDTLAGYAGTSAAARPGAVVAVHLYGHPCDCAALRGICDRHGLALIEDCAQAHGAAIDGRPVGGFGDAAAFSFYPTKNLGAFGDAGAVVLGDDAATAARCRALREYGWYERHASDIAGMNSRLDELHAAVLRVRLGHLDAELDQRRAAAARYDDALRGLLDTPGVRAGCAHAYHLYVVRTPRRAALQAHLADRGIGTGVHYPLPVHRQKAYAGRLPIGRGGMAVTDRLAGEVLSLPMHPFLSDADTEAVAAAVRHWADASRAGS
jgi:dTDP-4-amino-4,6-dideoxygalactose transaminase